ncbi:cystatin [Photobacterium angustum]|uniref:Cystatin n=2 Tax=Photobacterium angustum TaxID=661 RepID=A0ABX5H0H8_PHOAN|nr:cystatin domain-containing protein [Photobacterium angustum]KJG06735.1 cystatin [Photobacterium angustum]PSV95519.1 cystatin [Photobacterium angustum]PSW78967.1 cystatin [Photobacterium angustum]PSX05880.1 cystatin [Photobacterium angustum]
MNKKVLLIALSSIVLVACNSAKDVTSDEANMQESCNFSQAIVGGWAQGDITPEVEQAAKDAVKAIPGEHQLGKIYHVTQQVVAGMNYSITFSIENGDYYNATVFRSLQNTYDVKDVKQVSSVASNCDVHK